MKMTLLLVLFFFSIMGHANDLKSYFENRRTFIQGIRGVGKGGGFGEMQALVINSKMNKYIQMCIQKNTICNINSSEAHQLRKLSETRFELKIFPGCELHPIQVIHSNLGILQSCALYKPNRLTEYSEVKTFKEIATWVLSTRLAAKGFDLENSLVLSEKIFNNFNESDQLFAVNLNIGDFNLHNSKIIIGSEVTQTLSIEGTTKTFNLTSKLENIFICKDSDLRSWELEFEKASDLENDQGFIQSDIRWTCQGSQRSAYKGKLQIYFKAEKNEVLPQSLVLKLVGIFKF